MLLNFYRFSLAGHNEQNVEFHTRLLQTIKQQIGLRLNKKRRDQKLLRISPEIIWCKLSVRKFITHKRITLVFLFNQELH